jgi:hypothetical protein
MKSHEWALMASDVVFVVSSTACGPVLPEQGINFSGPIDIHEFATGGTSVPIGR